jgi:Na+(H+)/acetate symporter ActP
MTGFILAVRRVAIFVVVMLGYLYFRGARGEALAAIGLLSFAAIAQIFPSFLAALFWRRANARGVLAALIAGSATWIYTLLLPSFAGSRHGLDLRAGPDGHRLASSRASPRASASPLGAWRLLEPRGKCRGPRARFP